MKKVLFVFALVALLGSMANKSYAQLSDEEYNYVTMDLRGILNLTMTTNPQVDFIFKTIQEYKQGITQFNATQLEVDATLSWDLFVYANSDSWTQVEPYSTNGNNVLPAEILQIQSSFNNAAILNADGVGNAFENLKGLTNSGVAAGTPVAATQFLAGDLGTAAGEQADPGTASSNPSTHKFRIDMKLKPNVPATFSNGATIDLTTGGTGDAYAQAGYYYLEVVYSLVEDL